MPGGTAPRQGALYKGDSATSPFYIGLQGYDCQCNPFNGDIAEVRLWNTVRSESQIQADMAYSSGSQPGLLAYYHLNEGSGTNAYDASGNTNNGTLENGASWSSSGPPISLVVTNSADSGLGTLRSAIANADNGEWITFATNLSGATITLASTLVINTNVTIDASALPGGIQINAHRSFTVLSVNSGVTAVLNSLTIENGFTVYNATAGGVPLRAGGINNFGAITLNQCTMSGNITTNLLTSGGIYNDGTATLNQCTIANNNNLGWFGILRPSFNYAGGAGVMNDEDATMTLNQCTVSNNNCFFNGGGIYNNAYATITLNQCTLWGNVAQGLEQTANGLITSPAGGGGIFNGGTAMLNQCTVLANVAFGSGGGICNLSTMALNECTIAGTVMETASSGPFFEPENSASNGGGIFNMDVLTMTNTIVIGNSGSPGGDIYQYLGTLTYGGSNLVESVANFDGAITGPAPFNNGPNLYLAAPGSYGGPTQTVPPLPGSPAIGAGSVAANTFTTDQRGYPRTQNGLIDIGAVELPTVKPFTASPTNGTAPLAVEFDSTNVDNEGSAIVGWDWSFGDENASTNQNPTNIYNALGIYSPALVVTNSLGLALGVSGPGITVHETLAVTVTNTANSGLGTLRSAITSAVNGELITFATNLSGANIILASTLTITTNLMIDASALPGGIQINGSNTFTVLTVASGVTDVLNSLTITNGNAGNEGLAGGIDNNGTLTLNDCTLSGNYNASGSSGDGGGIYNGGTLTLNECILSGNNAEYTGGGIYSEGTMTLNDCTLLANIAANGNGGGIFNADTAALNDCTLSGNSATNVENGGGGIFNMATLTLNECTLSGNSGFYGGGIFDQEGTLTVTNTIIAENSAANSGTFGRDIYLVDSTLTCGGSNLIQQIDWVNGGINGPAPLNADPNIAPLGNYGGPTQTMPPLPGSPAIGAGSVAANTFATDQRGYPRTQNGLIDIGAVELPTVTPFNASPTNDWQSTPVQFSALGMDSDGSAIIGWDWSFGDGNTSSVQDPTNVYNMIGVFSPGLIVTNSLGLALAASGPAITVYPPLTLAGISLSGTSLTLSGGNGISGLTYSVLTTTNLALPLSQWTPLSTNTWSANGPFSLALTNVLNSPAPQRFYLLRVP